MKSRNSLLLLPLVLGPLLTNAGCRGRREVVVVEPPIHFATVSMDLTVVDQFLLPYEGLEVRLLEAWQEGTNSIHEGFGPHSIAFSDSQGRVSFDPVDMAESGLGFLVDSATGDAVLSSHSSEDEALLTVLVGSPSVGWFEIDVAFSYTESRLDVVVEI
ncbi:MAG: hypothetical protein ACE5F1_01085 [Planctomycetota bacterium]